MTCCSLTFLLFALFIFSCNVYNYMGYIFPISFTWYLRCWSRKCEQPCDVLHCLHSSHYSFASWTNQAVWWGLHLGAFLFFFLMAHCKMNTGTFLQDGCAGAPDDNCHSHKLLDFIGNLNTKQFFCTLCCCLIAADNPSHFLMNKSNGFHSARDIKTAAEAFPVWRHCFVLISCD